MHPRTPISPMEAALRREIRRAREDFERHRAAGHITKQIAAAKEVDAAEQTLAQLKLAQRAERRQQHAARV